MHCPGSNLKLGSGIAPVAEMRARGISVSLGADGAACNNRLDMFEEMRLAAMLQAVRQQPGALTARDALWMATRDGARALGLDARDRVDRAGQARRPHPGRVATGPHLAPDSDPYSTLVYAARGTDVRTTIVDGEVLVRASFAAVRIRTLAADYGRRPRDARRRHTLSGPGRCIMLAITVDGLLSTS